MRWCTSSADEAVRCFAVFLLAVCVCVCEAWLLQQKPGILNPQGSLWERKASRTIPVLGACGEIQRSVNLEPLSLLRAQDSGQCFTMASVHREGEEETEGERMAEGDNSGRGRRRSEPEMWWLGQQHTVSHNDGGSGLISRIFFRPRSHPSEFTENIVQDIRLHLRRRRILGEFLKPRCRKNSHCTSHHLPVVLPGIHIHSEMS